MTTTQPCRARTLRALPRLGALAVFLTACGGQPETAKETVDAEEVAAQIGARLAEQFGQEPDDLHCAQGLPAQEGATVTCALSDTNHVYDVTVTTTGVEGDVVNFDFEVAEEPRTAN